VTDYDPALGAILDRLVPPPAVEPNRWEELLREARVARTRRCSRVLVLVGALVVAVVVAIPALAVREGWWFLGPGAPSPTSDVVVVTSGRWAGIDWKMTAYVSADKGVCVALTPELGPGGVGGGMSCGSELRGEPFAPGRPRARHWVGYVYSSPELGFPAHVFGPIAEGVDSVDVVLSDGETLRTPALEAPERLGVPLGFYALPLPAGVLLRSVVARDQAGTVLEQRTCLPCLHPPWQSVRP
jgi:hypothetical protein